MRDRTHRKQSEDTKNTSTIPKPIGTIKLEQLGTRTLILQQLHSHSIKYRAVAHAVLRARVLANSSVTVGSALADSLFIQMYSVLQPLLHVERELTSLSHIPLILLILLDPCLRIHCGLVG